MSKLTFRSSNIYAAFCEAIPALVFLYLAFLVLSRANNIPFWDQWQFADFLVKYYEGTLAFTDFAESHNGHILVFPRLIMLLMALATQWDVRYELLANLLLGLGIYAVYRYLVFARLGFDKKTEFFIIPVLAIFVFSFKQHDNWIWGWQMQIFLCSLASICCLALLCLYSAGMAATAAAALAAVIATFSFATGIVLWPMGFLLLLLRCRKASCIALWLVLAIACVSIYVLQSKEDVPSSPVILSTYIKFIFVYLGSSLGIGDSDFSFYYGIFGIASAIFICFSLFYSPQRNHRTFLFFGAVMLFIILAAILTDINRAYIGLHVAETSRYASFSIHFWISLAGLMIFYIKTIKDRETIKQILLVGMVFIICASVHTSIFSIKYFDLADNRQEIIHFLKAGSETNIRPDLKKICWEDDYLLQQAAILKKYQLSFYAED